METDNKQAVLTALNRLVNYAAYDREPFFLVDLYDLVGREVAINSVLVASTDLERMLRNKQLSDRGIK